MSLVQIKQPLFRGELEERTHVLTAIVFPKPFQRVIAESTMSPRITVYLNVSKGMNKLRHGDECFHAM